MESEKLNKHELYQRSVQNVHIEVEFFKKIYRMLFNKVPYKFREDFCGTGLLSCEWVKKDVQASAVGLDIDQETIDWGKENNINNLSSGFDRIELFNHNVLEEFDTSKNFDVICSLNYSHFLLNKRKDLVLYFSNVRKSLKKGIFIMDFYGGSHIYTDHKYNRGDSDSFYEFRGKQMNNLANTSICSLNYRLKKKKYTPLYEFNFRIYSVIELREALEDCGFCMFKIYVKEIFDDEEDGYTEYQELDMDKNEFYPESDRYTGYLIAVVSAAVHNAEK